MADFSQAGVVPTLHDLGHRCAADLERELRAWAPQRPVALIIPCLASDVGADAFDAMVSELASADWLAHVVVGLDEAGAADCRRALALLERLPQRCDVLWNDSADMAAVERRLRRLGMAPASRGKGRNVWYCLGAVLAAGAARVIAMHDADIVGYSRELPARLAYPVAHPAFGYCFAKGYYHRVTDGRFGGRVTRLLVAPLVRALRAEAGEHPYLRFLEDFRYPLAGETAMDSELAARLSIPGHWGMDIGVLSDVFALCEPSSICQVSVADAYDHKHQELSADDPTAGLRRMSIDVAATIVRRLSPAPNGAAGLGNGPSAADGASAAQLPRTTRRPRVWPRTSAADGASAAQLRLADGAGNGLPGLCESYLSAARDLLRHYSNDAELNGYRVDVEAEQHIAEVFAHSVAEAVEACRADPQEDALNPSWSRVLETDPQIGPMLAEALIAVPSAQSLGRVS